MNVSPEVGCEGRGIKQILYVKLDHTTLRHTLTELRHVQVYRPAIRFSSDSPHLPSSGATFFSLEGKCRRNLDRRRTTRTDPPRTCTSQTPFSTSRSSEKTSGSRQNALFRRLYTSRCTSSELWRRPEPWKTPRSTFSFFQVQVQTEDAQILRPQMKDCRFKSQTECSKVSEALQTTSFKLD